MRYFGVDEDHARGTRADELEGWKEAAVLPPLTGKLGTVHT